METYAYLRTIDGLWPQGLTAHIYENWSEALSPYSAATCERVLHNSREAFSLRRRKRHPCLDVNTIGMCALMSAVMGPREKMPQRTGDTYCPKLFLEIYYGIQQYLYLYRSKIRKFCYFFFTLQSCWKNVHSAHNWHSSASLQHRFIARNRGMWDVQEDAVKYHLYSLHCTFCCNKIHGNHVKISYKGTMVYCSIRK